MAVVVVVKTQFSLGSGLMLAKCCQQMVHYARLIGNAYLFHIMRSESGALSTRGTNLARDLDEIYRGDFALVIHIAECFT